MELNSEQKKAALDSIKAVYDDGEADINGRVYKFGVMTFTERRKVFAYTSQIQHRLQSGDFSFLAEEEYLKIENIIFKRTTFDDMSLAKVNPFEEYMEDYMIFCKYSFKCD
jgi:hypothetical protein